MKMANSASSKQIDKEKAAHEKVVASLDDDEQKKAIGRGLSAAPEEQGGDFLTAVQLYLEDMLKYDSGANNFSEIRTLMLRAQLKLGMPLDNSTDPSKQRYIKKMTVARTCIKSWCIRTQKLVPRASDVDVTVADFANTDPQQAAMIAAFDPVVYYTQIQVIEALEPFSWAIEKFNDYVAVADPRNASSLPSIMAGVNTAMMKLMMHLSTSVCDPGSSIFLVKKKEKRNKRQGVVWLLFVFCCFPVVALVFWCVFLFVCVRVPFFLFVLFCCCLCLVHMIFIVCYFCLG